MFIHLRTHSAYSLSEGAIKVETLPKLCREHGMPALAITDSGNLFGSLEFSSACSDNGVQPIIGTVLRMPSPLATNTGTAPGVPRFSSLVLLAKDDEGYKNLLKLVSHAFLDHKEEPVATPELLEQYAGGLIALTGGVDGALGQLILAGQQAKAEELLLGLKELFPGRLYMELQRHGLSDEEKCESVFLELAYKHNVPLVATNDVQFSNRDMFEAHDALICVADGTYVSDSNRRRFSPEHYFKSSSEMTELFADLPEAVANTVAIAKRCAVMSKGKPPLLPSYDSGSGNDEATELKKQAEEGLELRLQKIYGATMDAELKKTYFDRLAFELGVISGMGFPGYFLIVSDFIKWSKQNGIPVGPGRGSGAGSVVAWAMQITDLDPLRFGLLFERFLNPERVSMPDFDVDFCQDRRDEVIRYVQRKYGKDRVAQIITFGKLQARAVLRDVGRVLQIPYGRVDKICKMIPFNPLDPITLSKAISMDPALRAEQKSDEQVGQLLDIGLKLEGLYRHASTHAAGVVIADRPLDELVPLYADPRSDMPVTQYSMKYAEKAGLVKFDFLGLKTLTTIQQAVDLIKATGRDFDINDIPFDDKPTFKLLSDGNATGVFQMESSGMRDALRKMKPDTIEDIIALISLYRPGPMENIPTYIARKHGKEEVDCLHPKLEECLKETFGVIIYQEQVMQIAQILGGYSLGGADLLRRAMGKKIKEEMDAQRELFVNGAIKNNVDKQQASDIFDLVAKFAGYGFNKSHAAAYAVIGYQTAYLKANFPVEFLTASMNMDIGDTDKINIFKEDALKLGIKVLPPDINHSGARFKPETMADGKRGIRYALGALKGVGLAAMEELELERAKTGHFKTIEDFLSGCNAKIVNKRQLESMARAGVFDTLNDNRRKLFEGASLMTRFAQSATEERESKQGSMFDMMTSSAAPVGGLVLPATPDWPQDERLAQEFDSVGFYLTSHPLNVFEKDLEKIGAYSAADLDSKLGLGSTRIKVAGTVARVSHRAANGKRFAYLTISDPTGSMEVALFNEDLINSSREILEGRQPLLVTVDARKDQGGIRLLGESIQLLESFLEGRNHQLVISLSSADHISEFNHLLEERAHGRAKVQFSVITASGLNVEIELPGRYALSRPSINAIRALPGVTKVVENNYH